MTAKNAVVWVCKQCGLKHEWMWHNYDFEPAKFGTINMICDECERETKVRYLKNGRFVSVDT